MTERPRYRLELQALPHVEQPEYALRQLLRRALRSYGLRCLSVEKCPPRNALPPNKSVAERCT